MEEIQRISFFSRLPKKIKVILILLSIITIVYWCIWLFIKLWTLIGKCLHWFTAPNHWWLYTSCVLLLVIGGLVIAELCSNIDPFTKSYETIKKMVETIRERIANTIRG